MTGTIGVVVILLLSTVATTMPSAAVAQQGNAAATPTQVVIRSQPVAATQAPDRGHAMRWWTVDGGGGVCGGGSFSLDATIAQPDAATISGTDFALDGGYWPGVAMEQEPPLFSDGFETGDTSRWSDVYP